MSSIQPWCLHGRNKELRSVRVRTSICHAQISRCFMLQAEILILPLATHAEHQNFMHCSYTRIHDQKSCSREMFTMTLLNSFSLNQQNFLKTLKQDVLYQCDDIHQKHHKQTIECKCIHASIVVKDQNSHLKLAAINTLTTSAISTSEVATLR